jgi:hypothetical protein
VFALPGAFTPTCSSTHVPRYNQLAPTEAPRRRRDRLHVGQRRLRHERVARRTEGLEHDLPARRQRRLHRGMGMLVDKNDLGFGERSWRYSMLVKDGVIEKMFIEPDEPGDPFEVSDADTMLAYVAPNAEQAARRHRLHPRGLPVLRAAKGMLHDAGIEFDELVLNRDYSEA